MPFLGVYRDLLSRRETSWLAVSALTTRIPVGVLNLALILAVESIRGSFASAAIVWTGYAFAYAICQPFTSRLADRSPRNLLVGSLSVHLSAYVVLLIALYGHAPTAAFIACATVLGATTPPMGPLVRAKWSTFVSGDRLKAAYALDAVITESTFIFGPLLVSGIILVAPAAVGIMVAAAATLAGVVIFLMTPGAAERKAPDENSAKRRSFALFRIRTVSSVLAMVGFHIFAAGCLTVTIVAVAASHHHKSFSGILLSVLSVGVVIGGLTFGGRKWPGSSRRQLVVSYAATAAILVIASPDFGIVIFGFLVALIGLIGGALDTLLQIALGNAAPDQHRTEAFAWLTTVMWASNGLGTALGGAFVSGKHLGIPAALLAAAAAMAIAAVFALGVPRGDITVAAPEPVADAG
jgi:predicted MFS family arabinose efflux permease